MDNSTTTLSDMSSRDGILLSNIRTPEEDMHACIVFPEFKYRDTAVNGWEKRNDVRESFQTDPSMVNTGQSVFRFDEAYLDHFKTNHSVRGYTGPCYGDYLPLDLDCDDLENGLKTVQDFLRHLESEADVNPGLIPVWFSGNKGFHIAIPTVLLGEVEPTPDLPQQFKNFVETIWGDWGFDMKIYDINRLIRSENTKHGESGLYKVRIPNVFDTDMDDVLELAKLPGQETSHEEYLDVIESPRLSLEFSKAIKDHEVKASVQHGRSTDWQSLIQKKADKGDRNNTAFRIAMGLRRSIVPQETILENMHGWNASLDEPLPDSEIEAVVHSAMRYGVATSAENVTYQRTDYGNAALFADLHGERTRYDHTRKKWFLFNGQYWEMDETDQVYHLAYLAARKRQEIAMKIESDEERKKDMKWALSAENVNRFRSTLSLAGAFPPIAVTADEWESSDWLIQFENGVYDLETATFRDGRSEDMIYQSTGYDYDPKAKCPVWENAILEMMAGDEEMVKFIQRAIGYSLFGSTREQCLFICSGHGCNGKSVVLDILMNLLGGYGINSPFSAFEVKQNEQSNELARLVGARLVSSSESSQSRRLNEERIKAITGGDKVTARFLYQEHFTFSPKFKLWFAVNTLPELRGTDNGIWRRIRVIPFDVSFKGREDFQLTEKLRSELPGIVNWAIRGAHLWVKNSLLDPAPVQAATIKYRSESDVVDGFLEEKTIRNPAQTIKAGKLYEAFRDHCTRNGQHAMTSTMFGRQMSVLGYTKRKSDGVMVYDGIGLNESLDAMIYTDDPFAE